MLQHISFPLKKHNEELRFKDSLTFFSLLKVDFSPHPKYQIALETKPFTSHYRGIVQ